MADDGIVGQILDKVDTLEAINKGQDEENRELKAQIVELRKELEDKQHVNLYIYIYIYILDNRFPKFTSGNKPR